MRVLVVEIYGRGGLTHYTYNLVSELARRGVAVTLVTAADYELAPRLASNGSGVRLEAILYRGSARARRFVPPLRNPRIRRKVKVVEYLLATPGIVRLYRKLRPDVVHLQGSNPILLVTLAALKSAGCRAVYTAHDVSPLANRGLSRLLDRYLYRLADRVVVHAEGDRDALVARFRIPAEKVSVIRHGNYLFFQGGENDGRGGTGTGTDTDTGAAAATSRHDARRALDLAPDAEVALFFGFLSWYKGVDLLLRAFQHVLRARPRARLLVAGDPLKLRPGELEGYHALARELAITGAIHWRTDYIPMDEVPGLFHAADCVVLPYREVTQSGVLHLAYAFARPVVATRVGGFPAAVEEGVTGLLVPPGDVAALAAALARLLGDPTLGANMGAAARRSSESSGWGDVAEATRRLYQALMRDDAVPEGAAA